MKDKRQRMALAWPYDPALAAYIFHAAAASAASANYPYSNIAAAAAASQFPHVGNPVYPYPPHGHVGPLGLSPPGGRLPPSSAGPYGQGPSPGPIRGGRLGGGDFHSPPTSPHFPSLQQQQQQSPLAPGMRSGFASSLLHSRNGSVDDLSKTSTASTTIPLPLASNSPSNSSTTSSSGEGHDHHGSNCHTCISVDEMNQSPCSAKSSPRRSPHHIQQTNNNNNTPTLFQPYKETSSKV